MRILWFVHVSKVVRGIEPEHVYKMPAHDSPLVVAEHNEYGTFAELKPGSSTKWIARSSSKFLTFGIFRKRRA